MRMPSNRFQKGEMVMGRWPGSSLYYEVKVLSYDTDTQLYTVIYKDGTELELKGADMKRAAGFRQSGGRSRSRSRSRSPSRRHSRSRSPARVTRRSTSRTKEAPKEPKLKDVLEVRVSPLAKPVENNSNNKHDKEVNDTSSRVSEKAEAVLEKNRVGTRYNLRPRKEDPMDELIEDLQKIADEPLAEPEKQTVGKTTELEFGGKLGAAFMILFLPAVTFFLLLMCQQKDPSLLDFPPVLPELDTLWDAGVFGIVALWFLFQALLYTLPVGKVVEGLPLATGKRLKYRINGFYAVILSAAALGVAYYQEVDLSYIHDHFMQFAVSSMILSCVLSVYLYVRSRWAREGELAPGGNSGNVIYDFYIGHELNPRIKSFDLKYFCELRPGLIGWIVINFSMLLAEMKFQKLDTPSLAMILVNGFQLLYVADALWHEEAILTTMDIVHDGFGFMLAFGDLVWVPFTYSLQAFYLVKHPNALSWPWVAVIVAIKLIGYSVFRKANSEKNAFRRNPYDAKLSHVRTIPTATGNNLLVSGLWGLVRHPNYLGDIIMALAWSLPCGFTHILPYFYVIYFICLLIHREARNEKQCRKKYGSAWDEYCRQVRYRIIPGVY